MRTNETKWRIKFYVEKRKSNVQSDNVPRKAPIYMYVTLGNGERIQIYTKESVIIEHFSDEYLQQSRINKYHFRPIKAQAAEGREINNRLEALAKEVVRLIELADRSDPRIIISKTYLKDKIQDWFDAQSGIKKEKDFLFRDCLDRYYQYSLLHHAPKTAAGFKQVRSNIEEFNNSRLYSKYLSCVDQKYILDFENFLITKTGKHNKKLSHNTYCKNLKILRTFLLWCKSNGFYEGEIRIKYKESESDILFLTMEQINKLSNATHSSSIVEKVKDVFIFECFTGLRYGDIRKLKKTDFKDGRVRYFGQKKRETVSKQLKLVDRSLKVVEKYLANPGDYLLPTYSNPNEYLKQAFIDAGLTEEVKTVLKLAGGTIEENLLPLSLKAGTHMGRKTFITTAILAGMPEATIKAITGHTKDSSSFIKYYNMTNKMVEDAMDNKLGKL